MPLTFILAKPPHPAGYAGVKLMESFEEREQRIANYIMSTSNVGETISLSLIQRKFSLGYNSAGRVFDILSDRKFIKKDEQIPVSGQVIAARIIRDYLVWNDLRTNRPELNKVVMTKIDDNCMERNIQPLLFDGKLWWTPDKQMYVYYTPTHWGNYKKESI